MTLAQIRSYVQSYMVDVPSTVTDALIDAWINEGLRKAESRHNFRYMEASLSATTVADTRKLDDKPALWKEARTPPWFQRDDGSDMPMLWAPSADEMRKQYDTEDTTDDGPPEFVLETESELHVYPFSDSDSDYGDGEYRVRMPYWTYSADLDADADSETENPLLGLAPWYPVWYATAEGLLLTRDESRAATYAQRAEVDFQLAVRADKRSRVPDRMTLVPRSGVYGSAISPRNRRRTRRGYLP